MTREIQELQARLSTKYAEYGVYWRQWLQEELQTTTDATTDGPFQSSDRNMAAIPLKYRREFEKIVAKQTQQRAATSAEVVDLRDIRLQVLQELKALLLATPPKCYVGDDLVVIPSSTTSFGDRNAQQAKPGRNAPRQNPIVVVGVVVVMLLLIWFVSRFSTGSSSPIIGESRTTIIRMNQTPIPLSVKASTPEYALITRSNGDREQRKIVAMTAGLSPIICIDSPLPDDAQKIEIESHTIGRILASVTVESDSLSDIQIGSCDSHQSTPNLRWSIDSWDPLYEERRDALIDIQWIPTDSMQLWDVTVILDSRIEGPTLIVDNTILPPDSSAIVDDSEQTRRITWISVAVTPTDQGSIIIQGQDSINKRVVNIPIDPPSEALFWLAHKPKTITWRDREALVAWESRAPIAVPPHSIQLIRVNGQRISPLTETSVAIPDQGSDLATLTIELPHDDIDRILIGGVWEASRPRWSDPIVDPSDHQDGTDDQDESDVQDGADDQDESDR